MKAFTPLIFFVAIQMSLLPGDATPVFRRKFSAIVSFFLFLDPDIVVSFYYHIGFYIKILGGLTV